MPSSSQVWDGELCVTHESPHSLVGVEVWGVPTPDITCTYLLVLIYCATDT
jgi:hypothetical protein